MSTDDEILTSPSLVAAREADAVAAGTVIIAVDADGVITADSRDTEFDRVLCAAGTPSVAVDLAQPPLPPAEQEDNTMSKTKAKSDYHRDHERYGTSTGFAPESLPQRIADDHPEAFSVREALVVTIPPEEFDALRDDYGLAKATHLASDSLVIPVGHRDTQRGIIVQKAGASESAPAARDGAH
jgi:hypothetical protein